MTSRQAKAPWGLVGMLALVAVGEWAFTRAEMDVIAPWHWDWRHTGAAARTTKARADVLCFGDSLLKFSVLPVVVEGKTGRSAYNFGVANGQTPSSYFLLRRALAAGAAPRAIVFDAVPIFLAEGPAVPRHLRQWPEMLSAAELIDLARTARDPDLLAGAALAGVLPTFRARDEIRASVADALKGVPSTRRFFAAQFWRNARVNRGANVMNPGRWGGDAVETARQLCGSFSCDPVNAAYLDRFLALACSRGVPVFWVIPPMADEVQAESARSGFDAAQTAFVRGVQARHRGVTVVDGRRAGYGRALYVIDPIHLNRHGAIAFSNEVAPLVARALAGERLPDWVTLPPYHPRPEDVPVEDISESAVAIGPGASRPGAASERR